MPATLGCRASPGFDLWSTTRDVRSRMRRGMTSKTWSIHWQSFYPNLADTQTYQRLPGLTNTCNVVKNHLIGRWKWSKRIGLANNVCPSNSLEKDFECKIYIYKYKYKVNYKYIFYVFVKEDQIFLCENFFLSFTLKKRFAPREVWYSRQLINPILNRSKLV